MYLDFSAKEIPSSAIRAVGSVADSCTPIYGSTNPYAMNMNEIIGYDCSGVGGGGGGGSTDGDTTMPPYNPEPPIFGGCDMLVLCADGTTQEACFQPFASLCTGRGGVYDPDVVYEPDVVESDDPCEGVRCIRLYKPCPEGYIDVSECCPNTGDCVPDPNYVAYGGLVQMQPIGIAAPALPIGQTPSANFDIPVSINQPVRSLTPLPFERTATTETPTTTTPTTATSTTETSTAEEPKQSGLGILVLGLIALEALAT